MNRVAKKIKKRKKKAAMNDYHYQSIRIYLFINLKLVTKFESSQCTSNSINLFRSN